MAWLPSFPSVQNIREVGDGERLRLGDVTVTALATPGHTSGSKSWTWRSCVEEGCVVVVIGFRLQAISPGVTFLSKQHDATERSRLQYETLAGCACDDLRMTNNAPTGG